MTKPTMVDKDYAWYERNYKDLYKKYPEKFLVISSWEVKGVFETLDEAYVFWAKNIWLGNFLLQKCEKSLQKLNFHGIYQIT